MPIDLYLCILCDHKSTPSNAICIVQATIAEMKNWVCVIIIPILEFLSNFASLLLIIILFCVHNRFIRASIID